MARMLKLLLKLIAKVSTFFDSRKSFALESCMVCKNRGWFQQQLVREFAFLSPT